jgi:predicted NBD/HSP70 family sugar kinase
VSTITLGIDVGGTTVKAAALEEGNIIWTDRSARYQRPTSDQLSAAIRQACSKLTSSVEKVGLCVPGLLDDSRRQVLISSNVPGLVGVMLPELIGRALDLPEVLPVVVNDANATAYDVFSTRRPEGRLLVLAIGTGVGASVLDNGKPLFVDGESPGHVGQIDVTIDSWRVIGPDGGRGGVEAYLGNRALRARYGPDASGKMRPGHPPFRALVRLLRICHAVYRPQHICLAGGTGIRLGHLLEPLRIATCVDLTNIARADWTLTVGESDFHAAAGAARIAADGTWPHPVV